VRYSFLRTAFSASKLVAETTGRALQATVSTIRLQAEIALGLFIKTFFIDDTGSVTDSDTLDVTKVLSETPAFTDDDTLDLTKLLSDASALSDDDILEIIKRLSDQSAFTDAHLIQQTKPLSNSSAVTEDAVLAAIKRLTEAPTGSDNDTIDYSKVAGDSTDGDYADIDYFALDYVVGNRMEKVSAAEEAEFTYVKNVSDQAFVTDDLDGEATTQDDQEIAFVKTRAEIISISDVFDRDVAFSRAFNETPAANDAPAKIMGRPDSDSFSASDSFSRTVVYLRNFTDSSGFTDSDTIDFGSVKSDDGLFADSEVRSSGKFVTESPSAASSGSLRSQGYCDFTYFAEDYVGASRTFT